MSTIGARLKKLEQDSNAGARLIVLSAHCDARDDDAARALREACIVPADRDLVVKVLNFGHQGESFVPHVIRISPI